MSRVIESHMRLRVTVGSEAHVPGADHGARKLRRLAGELAGCSVRSFRVWSSLTAPGRLPVGPTAWAYRRWLTTDANLVASHVNSMKRSALLHPRSV